MAPRPRRPAPLFLALALLASALGLAAAQQAAAVPAYLRSPFGARDDVCPPARGGAYEVNGFPGTPFVVTPFKDEFRNPPLAKSKGRTCRGDGHCECACSGPPGAGAGGPGCAALQLAGAAWEQQGGQRSARTCSWACVSSLPSELLLLAEVGAGARLFHCLKCGLGCIGR